MADKPAALPGADKMPGADQASDSKANTVSGDLVCYTGCSVNVGFDPNDESEKRKPRRVSLSPGETVDKAKRAELGTNNVKNLVAMGRLVPADSNEAVYIKDKVAKEAARAEADKAGEVARTEAKLAALKGSEADREVKDAPAKR